MASPNENLQQRLQNVQVMPQTCWRYFLTR